MAGMKQYPPTTRGKHKGEVRFRVSRRNSEGRQIGKTMYGRSNANQFKKDIESGFVNRDTGEYFDVEREQTKRTVQTAVIETRACRTFGNLASRFINVKRDQADTMLSTLEDYQQQLDNHILPTLGDLPLEDIGLSEIEDMVMAIKNTDRKHKPGPRTINKCIVLSRSIFQYGIDLRWCTENPATRKKIIKYQKGERQVIPPSHFWRIVDNIAKPYEVAILIGAFTGCRRGEAIALKWSDIDFQGRTILFERSFKTRRLGIAPLKTKQCRRLPVTDDVLLPLRELAAKTVEADPDDWLFPDPTGVYPIGGDVLLRRFKKAQKKAGLSGYVIHEMRHTAISLMGEGGVDPASAQGISGHSDLTTLMNVYTHARMEGKRHAVETLASSLNAARTLPGRKSGIVSEVGENRNVRFTLGSGH